MLPMSYCVMLDTLVRGGSVVDRIRSQFLQTLRSMAELGQMLETNEYPEGMVLPPMIEIDDLLANLMNDMDDDREIERFVKWEGPIMDNTGKKFMELYDGRAPLERLEARIEELESTVGELLNMGE